VKPATFASGWQQRLNQLPIWGFTLVLICFAVIKGGFTINALIPEPLSNYPTPPSTFSSTSYGLRTLAWILRMDYPGSYVVLGLIITAVALATITWAVRRTSQTDDSRIILVFILLGPITLILLNNIGQHDALMILGGSILGLLGRNWIWALVGAIIMVSANPEQAVVASILLLLMTFAPQLRNWRLGAGIAVGLSAVASITIGMWAHSVGVESRIGFITGLLGNSFYQFFGNFPLSVYAGYGITWVVVIWITRQASIVFRWLIGVALIAIPFFMTAITLDQTRVFVGLTTAAILAVLVTFVPQMREAAVAAGYANPLFWTFAAAIFLPAIEVWSKGYVRVPYAWFFVEIIPQVKTLLPG
jgi:hypothetical protein